MTHNDLPPLPQRIKGATLTPEYIDADLDAPVPYLLPPVATTALGDALRKLADLADAGILAGYGPDLTIHHDTEDEVRALAATLGAEVAEYRSHTDTVQVSTQPKVDKVRVTAIARTERPWVEVAR